MRNQVFIIVAVLIFSSCSSRRVSVTQTLPEVEHSNRDIGNYAEKFAPIAIREMQRTGVPASITLAQGIIESDFGRSRLAMEANNHFGIKCHSDWRGKKIFHDDDRRNECFRSYSRVEDSYIDHSDFLRNGSRYSFLFDLSGDDYRGWARGLKQAGYATNPKYANMIINMIEENDLSQYDQTLSGRRSDKQINTDEPIRATQEDFTQQERGEDIDNFVINRKSNRVKERNRIQYIIVNERDTYETIAKDYDLLSWELFRYNDLDDGMDLYPGQLLYLQPKRKKAEAGNDFHILTEGETIYSVSQLYGIKLGTLYERNGLDQGSEPPMGTELWLRKTKPEGL